MPKHKQELVILVGESGSGKSELAKKMVTDGDGWVIRLNRDELRTSLHQNLGTSRVHEDFIIDVQQSAARSALRHGFSVVIDDTNLSERTRHRWFEIGNKHGVPVRFVTMDTDLHTCLSRDAARIASGKPGVGRAVIERQFLESGRLVIQPNPIVIVDVDGTLANNTLHRSPYDESLVHLDPPYPEIVAQVRELAKDHTVIIVSGRHSTCGDVTVNWLYRHNVPFDHIFMRHGWDNRKDTVVKQEILNALLRLVPKEQIVLVIDDRPSVLNMWFDNGLKIQPAREVKEPF